MFSRFAVIGNPIEHSLSPIIHRLFSNQTNIPLTYEKIRAEPGEFSSVIADFFMQGGVGLNITLPFKSQAFELARQRSPRCQNAGAANTLWMQTNELHADNTDGIGLIRDLQRHINLLDKRILIIGAGGAARGIILPLLEKKPKDVVVANRTRAKAEEFQLNFPQIHCSTFDALEGHFDLVINATSASLAEAFLSLPSECMSAKPFCYDLSYKQDLDTPFLQYARKWDCEAVDGLGMLVEQAAEAFFIWHKIMPQTKEVLSFLRRPQRK